VAVIDGHLEAVSLRLKERAGPEDVVDALRSFRPATDGLDLPSAPEHFLHVFAEERFPQPRLHAGMGGGMTVSVGRVRACAVLGVKLVVLSHNTVRGAAGGALLNAELLAKKGYLQPRRPQKSTAS
jgi:aspartate-semialdehyde dehydrogenase